MKLASATCLWAFALLRACDSASLNARVDVASLGTRGWLKEVFPHPIKDPNACRTDYGSLCDPDEVLHDASDLQKVESALQLNRTYTLSCNGGPTLEKNVVVPFSVALLRKMDLSPYGPFKKPELGAKAFARYLYESWSADGALGTVCEGAGVLLFLSEEDRMIYVARGPNLATILSDDRVVRLIAQIHPLLRQRKYADAIVDLIDGINFFMLYGEPRFWDRVNDRPLGCEALWWPLALCLLWYHVSRQLTGKRLRKPSRWSERDSLHAEMLRKRFKAASCPICLAAFPTTACGATETGSDGLPLKLLRCGHVFDATCWIEWEKRRDCRSCKALKCLICQQDTDRPLCELSHCSSGTMVVTADEDVF